MEEKKSSLSMFDKEVRELIYPEVQPSGGERDDECLPSSSWVSPESSSDSWQSDSTK
jgi:hypothetical protein